MSSFRRSLVAERAGAPRVKRLLAAAWLAASAPMWAPQAMAATPAAGQDLGLAAAETPQTISLVLKAHRTRELAAFIDDTVDPHSPLFHRFLTTQQFADAFAPSQREIDFITRTLASQGITVDEVYADRLVIRATGTVGQFSQAFGTEIHVYEKNGKRFRRPHGRPHAPAVLQDLVLAVLGLNTEEGQFRSRIAKTPKAGPLREAARPLQLPKPGDTATGVPGNYTVGDVAKLYNVDPLYARHLSGKGTTIGIATLADFVPADAYTYWAGIGLPVKPDRITQVHVDGGGALSADQGSGETTLDVEQSGGLAPQADLIVYDAPNTDAGFTDVFYKAVSDNKVDTLSVSWGEAEVFYFSALNGGTDYTADMEAMNQAFMEAAAQGITLFASSGDSGAYELNGDIPGAFQRVLTVDSPAASPYVTAAGGTTLPVTLKLRYGTVVVPQERAWAWDYFNDYYVANYGPAYKDADFPVGGGGGVSVYWPVPGYQRHIAGVRTSEPNQVVATLPGVDFGIDPAPLPARFAGRNLPDVSLNADPESGYLLYSSLDGGWLGGYGGTSFVAPQLNGITALLNESQGSRIGFFNSQAYALAARPHGPFAARSPFNDIATGDIWFWQAVTGYDPAVGLGTVDVAKLDAALPRR